MGIRLTLNGAATELEAPAGARLVDVLRERAGLTGVKEGCGEGECGACTVLLDGEPVCSCLVLAGQAEGREVQTIEGLGGPDPHPLIAAMHQAGAVQCGFCSPGMVLSAKALLEANPSPSRKEIQMALSGNLCRCTGYHRIIDAVQSVAEARPAAERPKARRARRG